MKVKKIAFIAMLALCSFAVNAKTKPAYHVTVQEELKLDKYNKKLGYQFVENGEKIVFIFNASEYGIAKPKRVYVEGSFNGWSKKNVNWELVPYKGSTWIFITPSSEVMVPGNSGFPEFKFYVIAEKEYTETVCGKELIRYKEDIVEPASQSIDGYNMATNSLILLPDDDANVVIENLKTANKLKKLKEFNLDNQNDQAVISNVRLVPGTTKLFRGYHPYKLSRGQYDTEEPRIKLVNKALIDNGVKSIITLSGDEKVNPKTENISVYVGDIRRAGNQFFVNTSYNTVYYKSASKEFGSMMADIIKFIGSHPGPYYVHCRLGTDRTGVVSANLAALCGAGWDEIAADYQKTNEMGIREFRDYRLLKYSFEQMIGKPLSEVENLEKEVSNFYLENKFVTQADLDKLKANLK